jgi:hypothetical protein
MKRAVRLSGSDKQCAWTLAREKLLTAGLLLGLSATACAEPQFGAVQQDAGMLPQGAAQVGVPDASATRADAEPTNDAGRGVGADAAPGRGQPVADSLSDAAVPVIGAPDPADVPLADPSTLPSWAEPLLGDYVVQSYRFARDRSGVVIRVSVLSLVHITRNGPGAQMQQQICSLIEESDSDTQTITDPTSLTEVRQLQFSQGGWTTDASPIGFGYDRDVPAQCVGKENQAVPRLPEQTWLSSGTCRCPSSAELAPRIDDCRVRDPDHDGRPGIAFADRTIAGLPLATFHTVYVSRSHASRGRVATDKRHYASLLVDDVAYQMSCEPSGCPTISDLSRPCTSEYNGMQFVPLPASMDAYTCPKLVLQSATFFPDPPPAVPTNCTQQVLTDDPTRQ